MAKKVTILTELTHRETAPDVTGEVIAESPLMRKTLEMARQVAASDFSCLLITGESGTGKGLLAKTIHKMGGRADKPFVEVNCSALPTNLVESELFGHKRGAFTDAKENKLGLFEVADTGTLFLDEIGDMDFNLQAKLLKVIEEQKFRRIGDTNDISVDVSIIAATNQNVEQAVKENKFRIDLYYRLNVIPIHIPPLRDRKEDIPALTRHFISFFSRKFGREIAGVEEDAMESLLVYDWPGNIREFRNVIERGCILTRERTISDPSLLFPMGGPVLPVAGGGADADNITSLPAMPLKDAEKMVIRAAMEQARNNRNLAAQILGLHRSTLYKKLEEYGLG
jgi:transcriptional regulator with PAS, ATPase and Fis domain